MMMGSKESKTDRFLMVSKESSSGRDAGKCRKTDYQQGILEALHVDEVQDILHVVEQLPALLVFVAPAEGDASKEAVAGTGGSW